MEAALLRDPDVDYELTDLTQQVNKVVLAVNANKERFTKVDRATNQSVQILKEDLAELEFDNLVELGVMGLVNFLFCLFVIYNYYTKTCGSHNIASAITKIEANTQGLMNAGLKNVHFGQDQLKTAVADVCGDCDVAAAVPPGVRVPVSQAGRRAARQCPVDRHRVHIL